MVKFHIISSEVMNYFVAAQSSLKPAGFASIDERRFNLARRLVPQRRSPWP
jgi:hypothetical protein